jgi:cell division protein FtsA
VAAAGVVVTGGACIMSGVPELAEQVFDVPVRRGVPVGLSGLGDVVKSPIYATGVGLALYGARGQGGAQAADPADGSFARRFGRRVRGWLAEVL